MEAYNLMYAADFYKVSHKAQYPADVTKVHSTLVARGSKYNDNISNTELMWFGYSLYLEKLREFSDWFFALSEAEVTTLLIGYKRFLDSRLGGNQCAGHWKDLYDFGRLPLVIRAVPERSIVKFQTPLLTVENTHDDFAWLTSFIETTLLSNVWPVCTAANKSWHIRKSIEDALSDHTEDERAGIDFMGHDFSYRGMPGDEAAMLTGCGHLANFKGSDTIPAIRAMERVYGEVTGFSVPATEHSVMCAGGEDGELETIERIIDLYPTGIVSIVSDTWDYFKVLTETLPKLKDKILARDGKVVIRPDSGNPIDIVCGNLCAKEGSPMRKGTLRLLDEVFGHTLDSTGLKVLNSHVGVIYGDGMDQETIQLMLQVMLDEGYSPLNIVFGIGAYTYQYTTRDELGFAFKATAVERGGKWVDIQKDPKTDPGKKSLTGRFFGGNLQQVFPSIHKDIFPHANV